MHVPTLVFDQSEDIIWHTCESDDIAPDTSSVRSREL